MCAALCALLLTLAIGAEPQGQETTPVPPQWAYGFKTPLGSPPGSEPAAISSNQLGKDDGRPIQLPGSPLSLTLAQMRSAGAPVDWYPNDHPPMPEVVARNRPGVLGVRVVSLSERER
jgi:hypothetical protein